MKDQPQRLNNDSCAGFLEPRKSRLKPSKSTFNAEISHAAYPCLSQLISVQFAIEMCLAARNRQKIHKKPLMASRLSKVIDFNANREIVYDFLLVIKFYANICNNKRAMGDKLNSRWRPPSSWIYYYFHFWSHGLLPV